MTARHEFRVVMAERRAFQRGTPDHDYRSRAARKLIWIIRGVPADQWGSDGAGH